MPRSWTTPINIPAPSGSRGDEFWLWLCPVCPVGGISSPCMCGEAGLVLYKLLKAMAVHPAFSRRDFHLLPGKAASQVMGREGPCGRQHQSWNLCPSLFLIIFEAFRGWLLLLKVATSVMLEV